MRISFKKREELCKELPEEREDSEYYNERPFEDFLE